MRRTLLVAAGWALATVLATALAWQAVELVSSEVTQRPAAPLSNEQVARALAGEAGGAGGSGAQPSAPADTTAPPGGAAPTDPPAPGPGGAGAGAPRTTLRPAPTSTTSPPGAEATTSTTSTTATAAAPAAPAVTRTIVSDGGQVAVRYEAGRVELLWARPDSGFTVDVDKAGPAEVDVRFESDDHRSRVRAFWRDGAPAEEVREEDTSG